MAQHPPAARRAVIRRLKNGEHPVELLPAAQVIGDPGHAAAAMLTVATDDRLPAKRAAQAVRDAASLLGRLDRPGRLAEAWGDALAVAADIHRGPESDRARDLLEDACVAALATAPQGQWLHDALVAVAPHVTQATAEKLVPLAAANQGFEAASTKALLKHHPELEEEVRSQAPKAAHVVDDAAVWELPAAERREAIRVRIWESDDPARIEAWGRDAWARSIDVAHVWTMVAGRLDRIGADAAPAFHEATQALAKLNGKEAIKAHRKLAQSMERAGLTPPPPPQTQAESESAEVPVRPGERHAFCLVDGYAGGLGAPHVRAVARAAPLCVAFNLDLHLMGFPTDNRDELVRLVEAESNVGEGEGYAAQLAKDGRLHLHALEHGVPAAWPGTAIATTPHPDADKATGLEGHGTIALLVGLGKQGLPPAMLKAVAHHHELTGQGISMETATAMGILADRLGRVSIS